VASREFNSRIVGGKSNNLIRHRGKIPDWINIPVSVALPFMVFEKVLAAPNNTQVEKKYEELARAIGKASEEERESMLGEIRLTIQALRAPDELKLSLRNTMRDAGLPFPDDWENAWECITRVWASKWNGRAYLSRRAMGIPDSDLVMAVLIQQVVDAEYSFVIHTTNPLTGKGDEVYAEIVLGLGETLVANYPGRALSFSCGKDKKNP
jgi:alpha-glucan,water dikinase